MEDTGGMAGGMRCNYVIRLRWRKREEEVGEGERERGKKGNRKFRRKEDIP